MSAPRFRPVRLLPLMLSGLSLLGCPAEKTGPQVVTNTCTPNERGCVDDRVVRICPGDGLGYITVPCRNNEACVDGACAAVDQTPVCPPSINQCINNSLVRACSPDGTAWNPFACGVGEKCVEGACQFDVTAKCVPFTGMCVKGVPAVCKADGSGFTSSPCPTGTVCTGTGVCQGPVCPVGIRCSTSGNLRACADGTGFVENPCAASQSCIDPDPVHGAAACKQNGCVPGTRACGNKLDAAADQTKYLSECLTSPDGYKWVVTRCEGVLTCDSTGVSCSTTCKPGQTQCTLAPAGIATCGAGGQWGAPLACGLGQACGADPVSGLAKCADPGCQSGQKGVCTAPGMARLCTNGVLGAEQPLSCTTGVCNNGACIAECTDGDTKCVTLADGSRGVATCAQGRYPTTLTEVCRTPLTGANRTCVTQSTTAAVCADPECAGGEQGLCTADGKIRACVNGKLAAAGAAVTCPASEICVGTGCVAAACQAGETVCASGVLRNAYRTCQAGALSSTITFCQPAEDAGTGLTSCNDTRNASNLRTALCLECLPNSRKCATPTDGGYPEIKICDATGTWGSATACPFGKCSGNEPVAACASECTPGQLQCSGLLGYQADMNMWSRAGFRTCTSQGLWETTATACDAGTRCRETAGGAALGCLDCVGTANEANSVDVHCTAGSDGGLNSIQACGADNLWPTASVSCNGQCTRGSGGSPAYCPSTGLACSSCAQTTCSATRAACLADPICLSVFEGCLVTNGCYFAPNPNNCLHGCNYFVDAAANNYHNCLTHTYPPLGCEGPGFCM